MRGGSTTELQVTFVPDVARHDLRGVSPTVLSLDSTISKSFFSIIRHVRLRQKFSKPWGVKMAIGLNDLRKHLLSQSKVEPLHVVPPPEKPVALQSLDDRRDATEPQIYSVRKLLQNVSPDLEPVEQPATVANASTEHVSEAPDGATSEDASSPKGLSDAVLSYVEKTGARD